MSELLDSETFKHNPGNNQLENKKENQLKQSEDDASNEKLLSTDNSKPINNQYEEDDIRKEILRERSYKELLIKSFPFALVYWKRTMVNTFERFLNGFLILYSPILHGKIIDSITNQKDPELLWYYFKLNIAIYIYDFIIKQITEKILSYLSNNEQFKMKALLMQSIAEKDIEFFDLFETGELIQRINSFQGGEGDYLIAFFRIFNSSIESIILIIQLWSYTTDIIITNIIVIIISMSLSCMNERIQEWREKQSSINREQENHANYLSQFISNIRMIKSFNCEQKEINKINAVTDRMTIPLSSSKWILMDLQQLCGNCSQIILLLVAGLNSIQGKMTYGDLIVFQSFQSSLELSLNIVKMQFGFVKNGLKNWQKFFEIYDYKPKIVSLKNLKPEEFKGEIKFQDVSFVYPHKKTAKILQFISFVIKPGKVVALTGQSGCGKTTIAYLLQRFYDPYEGDIIIDGNNIKDFNLSWLRRKIGFVAQEPILNAGTIEENITYGCDTYTQEELNEACRLANVTSFISDKALFPEGPQSYIGERGVTVSGGQKQRIAIARALIKNSQILILDEATSALDSESENEVQKAIDNIIKERHITTLIIAHRLCTIRNADLILYLEKGKVLEQGTHDQLVELDGKYKKLVHKQLE